jgi:hypothetical protein
LASTWWVSIASRRFSAVWESVGSGFRVRLLKVGASESWDIAGWDSMAERVEGGVRGPDCKARGMELRKVVMRWELWITMGSSVRMSLYLRVDFWRLERVLVGVWEK